MLVEVFFKEGSKSTYYAREYKEVSMFNYEFNGWTDEDYTTISSEDLVEGVEKIVLYLPNKGTRTLYQSDSVGSNHAILTKREVQNHIKIMGGKG